MIKFEHKPVCSIDSLANEINENTCTYSYTYVKILLMDFLTMHDYFNRKNVYDKYCNSDNERNKEIYKEIIRMIDNGEIPEEFIAL